MTTVVMGRRCVIPALANLSARKSLGSVIAGACILWISDIFVTRLDTSMLTSIMVSLMLTVLTLRTKWVINSTQ